MSLIAHCIGISQWIVQGLEENNMHARESTIEHCQATTNFLTSG